MYVSLSADKHGYTNGQIRGLFFFQKCISKLRICTTESPFFTNKSYKLVVLLCEGSAKVYQTLSQQERETHLCFCNSCIGLTKSQPKYNRRQTRNAKELGYMLHL